MTSIFQGPGPAPDDLVVSTVNDEVRQEALRQIESIDYDDENWRIEPLPTFSVAEMDNGEADEAPVIFETAEEANRRNN